MSRRHLDPRAAGVLSASDLWEEEILEVLPSLPNPRYPPVRAIEFHTRTTSKYYGDDYAVTGD